MSLRTRVLLGIAIANFVAFSVLATLVLRDVERRQREERQREVEWRETFVERTGDLFAAFLSDADFARDVFATTAKNVLTQRYWAYARDAYICSLLGNEHPFFGDFHLNLTGAPDRSSEDLRAENADLVRTAFRELSIQRRGDVVVIPLYRTPSRFETTAASTSGSGARREKWGAAYIRVAVPERGAPREPLTLRDVALAMGGATLAGMGLVYLLLFILILRPLGRIAAGVRRISSGDLTRWVAETGRGDEIDQLIRTFNEMQLEIHQSRKALENRVAEVVDRMRDAEKRMVLNERLAAVGTLASGIAHEINNPLGGMMNALNTLRRRRGSKEQQERYLGLVDDGLIRIKGVVQRVLRFSRSAGAHEWVVLADVVEDAAKFVRHRLAETAVELTVSIDPELGVQGDPAALGQVMLNLILNALDAIVGGENADWGEIEVTGVAEGEVTRVTIRDNGAGMSEEVRNRAFDHFYTTKALGTGIGLSIVHQIIVEHGGTIAIESEVGHGTAIHLLLPSAGR